MPTEKVHPDPHDLTRFVSAQSDGMYEAALAEIRAGKKRTHWIWFVFPQAQGLGRSSASQRYSMRSLSEAKAYAAHPVLGQRLRETVRALLELEDLTANEIFGNVDAMKVKSSLTLFAIAVPEDDAFGRGLSKFYGGVRCAYTDGFSLRNPD